MRLWSLHPRQLDRIGLVACWREALLAQAVLAGRTRGYRHHPQLDRFRADGDPLAAIGSYLTVLAADADARGYRFDATRIRLPGTLTDRIWLTTGQLDHEWRHLGAKLEARSPAEVPSWRAGRPAPHPLFRLRPGVVEAWERG